MVQSQRFCLLAYLRVKFVYECVCYFCDSLVIVVVDLLLPLAALGNFKILKAVQYIYIYILESKKVNWRVKVFLF